MSHVVEMSVHISDLDALSAACKALGTELVRNQKTHRWYGRFVGDSPMPQGFTVDDLGHCDHAIRVSGNANAYEIGVVKRRDGKPGYTLLVDLWQGGYGLEAKIGKDGNKLKQQYAVQVGKRWAAKNGMRVTTTIKEDGRIILRASK